MKKLTGEPLFTELSDVIKKHEASHGKKLDLKKIKKAYDFANAAHEGQFRMSGLPYITHCLETAKILAELGSDQESIVAGLLHDVPEDTNYTVEDIEKRFGKTVGALVEALTKLSKVYFKHSMNDRQIESLRKMFLETAKDPRVVVIKLADRLHNMSTLHYLRPEKQQRIAKETLEIFVPLANLYGIYQLRRQLEDYCFMILQPEEYERIRVFVHDHEKKRSKFIRDSIRVLDRNLKKMGIKAQLEGRPKHLYSIYQKTLRGSKVLQDIYDYFAIRIITEKDDECYRALGVVHGVFKPKPGRLKDYIALPKANGYQSLHTTVIGLRGKLTEVQIRTKDMHEECEYGAAAHHFYTNEKRSQVRETIERLTKYKNPESFIRGLQEDLLQHRIFVFSAEGKIVNLPQGATCLDFVYTQNVPVKDRVFRALVNGKPYSLIGELQSGDTLEIVISPQAFQGSRRWWLEHVKTAKAKEAIIVYLKNSTRQELWETGARLLQQELTHESAGSLYHLSKEKMKLLCAKLEVEHFDDVLRGLGRGQFTTREVYRILFPVLKAGFVARTRIMLHKAVAKWTGDSQNNLDRYNIRIRVDALDRVGFLREVLDPFYRLKTPILRVWGYGYDSNLLRPNERRISRDIFDVIITDHEQLISLFDRLEKIPGVLSVQRVFWQKQAAFYALFFGIAVYFSGHFLFLQFFRHMPIFGNTVWVNIIVLSGLGGIFILLMWLRSLGNKSFPQFEETKAFWPMAFVLTFFAIAAVFADYWIFDLNLYLPLVIGVSLVISGFLTHSYILHRKRRLRHFHHLDQAGIRARSAFKNDQRELAELDFTLKKP